MVKKRTTKERLEELEERHSRLSVAVAELHIDIQHLAKKIDVIEEWDFTGAAKGINDLVTILKQKVNAL